MESFANEINKLYTFLQGTALMLGTIRCIFIIQKARNDEKPLSETFVQCKKIVIVVVLICTMRDIIELLKGILGVINSNYELTERVMNVLDSVRNIATGISLPLTTYCVIKELLLGIENLEEKELHFKKAFKNLVIGISIIVLYPLLYTIAFNYFNLNV